MCGISGVEGMIVFGIMGTRQLHLSLEDTTRRYASTTGDYSHVEINKSSIK